MNKMQAAVTLAVNNKDLEGALRMREPVEPAALPMSVVIESNRDKVDFQLNGKSVFKLTAGGQLVAGEGMDIADEATQDFFRVISIGFPKFVEGVEDDLLLRLADACKVRIMCTDLTNRVRALRERRTTVRTKKPTQISGVPTLA